MASTFGKERAGAEWTCKARAASLCEIFRDSRDGALDARQLARPDAERFETAEADGVGCPSENGVGLPVRAQIVSAGAEVFLKEGGSKVRVAPATGKWRRCFAQLWDRERVLIR